MPFVERLPDGEVGFDAADRAAFGRAQDDAWLARIPEGPERDRARLGGEFLGVVREGRIDDALRFIEENSLDINGTFGRMGATSLSVVGTPSPGKTPDDGIGSPYPG